MTAQLTAQPADDAVLELAGRLHIHNSTARSALLLDAVAPGWDDNVNLDIFDIYSTQRCILGQQVDAHPYFSSLPLPNCSCGGCSSDFARAIDKLSADCGSDVDDAEFYNFSQYGHEWRLLILDRRLAHMDDEQ